MILRCALVLAGLLGLPAVLSAQEPLTVETNLPADGWIDRDVRLEIRFGRTLQAGERAAVFFDHTDVTALFVPAGEGLAYDPASPPLPRGEGELVVYLVGAGWTEALRQPLRVRSRLGFEQSSWDPGIDLSVEGQVAADQDPDPEEDIEQLDQKLVGQFVLRSNHVRQGMVVVGETTFVGSSDQEAALRFGEEGDDAPKIDLSSYRVDYRQGDVSMSLGAVGFGQQKHLINGFTSRGTLLTWSPGERVDFSLAMVNGNNVVGWDNFFGLEEPDHRVSGAILGLEALERPGGLRFEATWLDSSILAGRSGFNQGDINDAEESRGFAVAVTSATAGQRFSLQAGFARSTYENPFDPTLAQGDDLVEVEEETKNARYVEASAGILKDLKLGENRTASLDLAFRHERIDPEYQTVGAFVRPDQMQNQVDLRGTIAGVRISGSHARNEDNLDDIASILKTRSRQSTADISIPFAQLFGVEAPRAAWLPQARYAWNRTHQFGEGVPENSGFNASHVPDQVSVQQNASLDWHWSRVNVGWQLNHSDQDNRQQGRENADLVNLANTFVLGVRPIDRLSVDLELNLERRESKERDEVDKTRRVGARTSLGVLSASQLSLTWSMTHREDEAETTESDDTSLDLQWASAVPYLGRFGGQYFVRLSRSSTESLDRSLDIDDDRSDWRVESGLNFSFFQ